ncbi:hypothetical protein GY45DRAFT_536509 [Cubamyces sp. BRFM 1775]|nr:hypothetical protein GY45DRAFT_536509 [Cubamyces sp. BRFM 1775]
MSPSHSHLHPHMTTSNDFVVFSLRFVHSVLLSRPARRLLLALSPHPVFPLFCAVRYLTPAPSVPPSPLPPPSPLFPFAVPYFARPCPLFVRLDLLLHPVTRLVVSSLLSLSSRCV